MKVVLLDREGTIIVDPDYDKVDSVEKIQLLPHTLEALDSAAFRRHLRERGISTNIPERKYKHRRKVGRKPHYNKAQFRFRAFIERTNAWLKYFRKLRYRWERKKCMFQAMVDLACLLICLRRVEI